MNAAHRSRGLSIATLMGLLCMGAAALLWAGQTETPSLAQRVKTVASSLRCPVCHGESVYDSPAALAGNMRAIIRAKLAAGESESQVEDFFVARYGNWILLAPPASGIGWLVWLGPPVLLLLGVAGIGGAAVTWRKNLTPSFPARDVASAEDAGAATDILAMRVEAGEISAAEFEAQREELKRAVAHTSAMPDPVHPDQRDPKPAAISYDETKSGRTREHPDGPAKPVVPPVTSRQLRLQIVAVVSGAIGLAAIVSLLYQPEVTALGTVATAPPSQLAAAKRLARTHPRSSQAWLVLGDVQLGRHDPVEAERAYRHAVNLAPNSPGPRIDLSYVLIPQGHARDALSVLRPLIYSKNSPPQLWLLEGLADRALNLRRPELHAFRRFLARTPRGPASVAVRRWVQELEALP